MRRLVLWDVDGTLLHTTPVGMNALHRAIEKVVGRRPESTIAYAGMLDPDIVCRQLDAMGVDVARYAAPVLEASVEELDASRSELVQKGSVMPGVPRILERLSEDRDVLQTVLTGNLRANAALKLSAFGLERWLDLEVGAYGEDGSERAHLVGVSLRRATELRNRRYDNGEVWVVGDTQHDLACAHGSGVRCLLVETGWEPIPESASRQADSVVADLEDTDRVLAILGG